MPNSPPPGPLYSGKSCRRRFLRKVKNETNSKLRRFRELSSLDAGAKQRLSKGVKHLEMQLSALEVLNRSVKNWVVLSFALLSYALIPIGPLVLGRSLPVFQEKFLDVLSTNAGHVVIIFLGALVLLLLPVFLFVFASRRAIEYFRFSTLLNVWMMLGTVIYAAITYRIIVLHSTDLPSIYEKALVVALASVVSFITVLFIGTYLSSLIERGLEMRKQRLWPNAVVADLFLEVLSETDKQQHQWKDVEFKQKIIRILEEIADCVEKDFPLRLRSGNAATEFWQKQTAEQIGAGVRNLIMWVYTPKDDTRQQFISRVTNYFTLAVNGDWDGFERVQPQSVSRPELLRSRLKSAVTAVLSAMIPLIVLVVVKRLNLIEGVVLSYLTVGAFIWTGLSLLSQVDPSYGSKLTAIKDLSSLLPLPKRDKD